MLIRMHRDVIHYEKFFASVGERCTAASAQPRRKVDRMSKHVADGHTTHPIADTSAIVLSDEPEYAADVANQQVCHCHIFAGRPSFDVLAVAGFQHDRHTSRPIA